MKPVKTSSLPRRLIAVLLSVCLVVSLCEGLRLLITPAYAESTGGPTQGVTRQADPSTMDTYAEMLNFSENSRYAGRLWSDKTVFALGDTTDDQDDDWDGDTLTLNMTDDGVNNRKITLDEDFLHVYSVLGSSLEIQEVSPLDVMFVVDVSGSMGNRSDGNLANKSNFNSDDGAAISKAVKALNSAIEQLLEASPDSRFGIAIYGSTAAVLVPLGHYTKSGSTDFLKVTYAGEYSGGLHYSLEATVLPKGGEVTHYYADNAGQTNNQAHDAGGSGNRVIEGTGGSTTGTGQSGDPYHVGHITNPQAGLAAAMDQFIEHDERTWQAHDGKRLRIPALIHLTDGQASDIAWIQESPKGAEETDAEEWEKTVSNWNNVNWKYDLAYNSKNQSGGDNAWNASQLTGKGDAAPVIFQTLMTAAYYKSAVDAFYNQDGTKDVNGNAASLACYSVYASDDEGGYEKISKNQVKATIDAILGPTTWFKDDDGSSETDSGKLADTATAEQFIDTAYELYKKWLKGTPVNDTFSTETTSSDKSENDITIKLNANRDQAAAGMYRTGEYADASWSKGIDAAVVEKNINYVPADNFFYTGFDQLTGVFGDIVQELTEEMFAPVNGMNDLGVKDSVTYVDPVGKYMDVKDVKGVSLFGEYHGITKTAVYDYQWNDLYMTYKGGAGVNPLPAGWYFGDPSEDRDIGISNVKYCATNEKLASDYGLTSEKAWEAGWVYRVGYTIAGQFVPTLKNIYTENENPDDMTTKARNTEYTFYRLDIDSSTEREALHMNPAYGTRVPTGVTYDGTNQVHLKTPGVYALADMRIWVEDTGDFSDDGTDLLTDTNYDEALWVNIPVNMLPLRKITINEDVEGNFTYETNVPTGTISSVTPYSDESASFPLRVYYTVGVSDDVLGDDNRINMAESISVEYTTQNKITSESAARARGLDPATTVGAVEFFSNWYNPLNRYSDYATNSTDYTYGDPVTSFSPTEFGGRLLAQDLVAESAADADKRQENIWTALNDYGKGEGGGGGGITTARAGDIILLKDHRLDDVTRPADDSGQKDPFNSNDYFYLAVDFYTQGSGGEAEYTQYVITRKSSEFGSAYKASGIQNGDMLVWHDLTGANPDYRYLSYTDTNAAGTPDPSRGKDYIGYTDDAIYDENGKLKPAKDLTPGDRDSAYKVDADSVYVVCAKPGGLLLGGLSQAVQEKAGVYSSEAEQARIKKYYDGRYPETELQGLTWGFYSNNVTRTANNYYLPTISTASVAGENDIIVNVYLGNNGRLYVPDTTLLVSKLIEPDAGMPLDPDEQFNFQVFISGINTAKNNDPYTVTQDAVMIKYNNGSWQRQFHYIDLQLDPQLFLQTTDGKKALVDSEGCRVVLNPNAGTEGAADYIYAKDCTSLGGKNHTAGEEYDGGDGGPFYVYLGKNTEGEGTGETTGSSDLAYRVYHNREVDSYQVSTEDVTIESGGEGTKGTFFANTVWLVSVDTYTNQWQAEGAPLLDPVNTPDFKPGTYGGRSSSHFELLTIDPDAGGASSTDITITTDYLIASSYWTETVVFGANANNDGGPGAVGERLTKEDLYDDTPIDDLKDLEVIAANTAEISLKHGYGLLFNGIAMNADYRVTEKLTDEQMEMGYALKRVEHVQQDSQRHQ